MQFEWDPVKNRSNKRKHGLSFEAASFVFQDPFLLSVPDDRYASEEERWQTLGAIQESVIYVAHTVREDDHDKEIIRIISARAASPHESRRYYANRRNGQRN